MTDSGGTGSQQNFSYDAYGNMWSTQTGSFPVNPGTPSSNLYNSANQLSTATYDGVGNQTSLAGLCSTCLTYDAENRLVSYSGSPATTFSYDASGGRVANTTGSTTTVYVYI